MRISILIFDGFTTLDAVGGYEVLSRIPGMEVEWVAENKGVIAADTRQLGLIAFRDFAEVTTTDILYVPGGPGGLACETDERFLDKIRELDRTSTWTIGICNGVGILAAAGLLEGRKATTNWFYQDRLREHGVEFVPERYHRDGKYITGGGVSASIDTALFVAQELVGDTFAKALQLGIEHYPAPPFPEKTAAEVPDDIKQLVKQYGESGGAQLLARRAPWLSAAE